MIRALIQGSAAEHLLGVGGVTLIGVNRATLTKLLITFALIIAIALLSRGSRALMRALLRGSSHERGYFWGRQAIRLLSVVVLVFGIISVWFDDPARLATAMGLVSAGVAIALQRVVTAFAAYLIILRGRIFNVGDRITIGGVRGDVVALDFMQTTVIVDVRDRRIAAAAHLTASVTPEFSGSGTPVEFAIAGPQERIPARSARSPHRARSDSRHSRHS